MWRPCSPDVVDGIIHSFVLSLASPAVLCGVLVDTCVLVLNCLAGIWVLLFSE